MIFQKDLILKIGLTLIVIVVLFIGSSHLIFLNNFVHLEEQQIQEGLQRTQNDLSEDLSNLNTIASEYADWDDTYAFVNGELTNYPQVNFTNQTFQLLHVNLVIIVNPSGQIIYGTGFDLVANQPTPIPPDLLQHITPADRLLNFPTIESNVNGVILLSEGPMFVAARPILTSDYQGPIRGTLIIGSYLSTAEMGEMSSLAGLSLTYHRFNDPQLPADFLQAQASLSSTSPTFVHPLDNETIAGYMVVSDVYGKPAILLRGVSPRDIYLGAQANLNYFTGWFIVECLIFSLVLYFVLNRLEITRLARQSAEAKYKTLVERIPAITYIASIVEPQTIQYVSPQVETLLGFAPEMFIQDTELWFNQIPIDDRERVRNEHNYILAMDEPFHSEHRICAKDGRLKWVRDDISVIKDTTGKPIALQGFILDVTELKLGEEALRNSELKFRTIIEQSLEGVALLDEAGNIIEWNQAIEKITGLKKADVLGSPYWDVMLKMTVPEHRTDQIRERIKMQVIAALTSGHSSLFDKPIERELFTGPAEKKCYIQQIIFSIKTDKGYRIATLIQDISERKRQEGALQISEANYRSLIESSTSVIAKIDAEGIFHFVNKIAAQQLGREPHEIIGKKMAELFPPEIAEQQLQMVQNVISQNRGIVIDAPTIINGQMRWYQNNIQPVYNNSGQAVMAMLNSIDISEHRQAEEAVKNNEKRFRALIENGLDNISLLSADGILLWESPAVIRNLGYPPDEFLGRSTLELVHPDDLGWILSILAELIQKPESRLKGSFRMRRVDGTWRWVEAVVTNLLNEPSVNAIVVNYRDITERKQAEDEIVKLHRAVESSGEVIFLTDGQGVFSYVNPEFINLYGYTAAEVIGLTTPRLLKSGTLTHDYYEGLWKTIKNGQVARGEWVNKTKNGQLIPVEGSTSPIQDEKGNIIGFLAVQRDMTERKQAEEEIKHRLAELEAINQLSTALRSINTLDEMISMVLDITLKLIHSAAGCIWMFDSIKNELGLTSVRGWGENGEMFFSPTSILKEGIPDSVFITGRTYTCSDFHFERSFPEAIQEQLPSGMGGAIAPIRAANNMIGTIMVNVTLPRVLTSGEVHLITMLGEIAGNAIQRTTLSVQTESRLKHISALRDIDQAITSILDINLILRTLLVYVTDQLAVDTAAFLLLNSNSLTLEYGSARGFRSNLDEDVHIRLGESLAGRAALEHRLVSITEMKDEPDFASLKTLCVKEGFVSYYGVPLLSKGITLGVLEVFHRTPLEPNQEWLDFFYTLANMAAIAIDNARLFKNLQQSNAELIMAYDATIEGWSKALDLRDEETEGHTQRVTDITVRLAQKFGLSGEELVRIRWGALLHDIGKMGVPDNILLKPGSLTEEEWVIMKKHPEFAYKMLSPIRYLGSALDIPYCHHEKWDGSGYPRGLKGEEIPLIARIFSIVDVWDALRSDRPYRAAWPEEKAHDYVRSLAGHQFDPRVVKIFLETITPDPDL